MKAKLRFENKIMKMADFGEKNSVPDLMGGMILQNNLEFQLGEEEEIFEAYGRRETSYPYKQRQNYSRVCKEKEVFAAILENEYLLAVFLPEYGGRLWELWDKEKGENLLYTNDVLRCSNLAVCNAWFSGGVEWNVSLIGHTPFTTEKMYTARLKDEQGNPVLRMYEYERVRGIEYQMDFWLGEQDRFLNCRMRIVNKGTEVVPMYWWSNMAVPEYKNGRIIVPAESAYTNQGGVVYKTDIPYVNGVDVTRYETIPEQIDYFFNIKEETPKYIANINENGYGLLQCSTSRLKGRKMFSWGHLPGGDHWQEFLTEQGGKYLEIQAGLAKTQYGCLPMPPHSAWEWLEQYGSIQIERTECERAHDELSKIVTEKISEHIKGEHLEEKLIESRGMALTKGTLVQKGSGYGALEKLVRPLSKHLEYAMDEEFQDWKELLEKGYMRRRAVEEGPAGFVADRIFLDCLKRAAERENQKDWHVQYQMGILYLYSWEETCNVREGVTVDQMRLAEHAFMKSLDFDENPWAYHGLAFLYLREGRIKEAVSMMKKGMEWKHDDLSYVKVGLQLLREAKDYEGSVQVISKLPEKIRHDERVQFEYLYAVGHKGNWKEVWQYLKEHPDYSMYDLRECETSITELWKDAYKAVFGEEAKEVPYHWDYNASTFSV